MRLAKSVGGSNGTVYGVGREQEELADCDDFMVIQEEDGPAYAQTALTRRRRRVCSCSSQTDLRHSAHTYSPTPGTASPTASILGFNIPGR